MALILRNTSGTYDMAIECRLLIQDMPESNLTPRLWDMLYRGNGVILPDVHQVIDNGKGQWDWEMLSRGDNAFWYRFCIRERCRAQCMAGIWHSYCAIPPELMIWL